MNKSKTKQEIRKKLLRRRSELGRKEYQNKSEQIIQNLEKQLEFKNASTIHCYVSMNERNEVNTHSLIKHIIDSGKKLAVSITNFDDGTLSHRYLNNFEDLQRNKWGVLEPGDGEEADVEDLDLIIVPMVGGDEDKNRIGYGKGFYDRFLEKADCPTIGLLFDCCLVESIPVESFDVALHKCITETKVIS